MALWMLDSDLIAPSVPTMVSSTFEPFWAVSQVYISLTIFDYQFRIGLLQASANPYAETPRELCVAHPQALNPEILMQWIVYVQIYDTAGQRTSTLIGLHNMPQEADSIGQVQLWCNRLRNQFAATLFDLPS